MLKLKNKFEQNGGEWSNFKLKELFDSQNGDFDIQQKHIDNTGEYVVSSGVQNNGIIGKSSIRAKVIKENSITVDMFGNVFFRDFPYKMVTHARVFSLSSKHIKNRKCGLYISALLSYLPFLFSYSNMASWNKIKDFSIKLPVNPNGEIAYDYMSNYISELEQERISELEQERISELEAYLKITGLENYELTSKEQKALKSFRGGGDIELEIFKIGDLFYKLDLDSKSKLKTFNKTRDISKFKTKEFSVPLVNAKHGDNGIMYYGREKDFETAQMTIDIVNDGAIATGDVYAQPQRTGVLYNAYLIKPYYNDTTARILLYFSQTLQKAIKYKYGYDNKAGWAKVREEKILLPTSNNKIDYEFMELYIRAIEKLVIKNVVNWKNQVITAHKKFINSSKK